jgi:hypothetical protein
MNIDKAEHDHGPGIADNPQFQQRREFQCRIESGEEVAFPASTDVHAQIAVQARS